MIDMKSRKIVGNDAERRKKRQRDDAAILFATEKRSSTATRLNSELEGASLAGVPLLDRNEAQGGMAPTESHEKGRMGEVPDFRSKGPRKNLKWQWSGSTESRRRPRLMELLKAIRRRNSKSMVIDTRDCDRSVGLVATYYIGMYFTHW